MSYKISLSEDSVYIILEATGEITRENAMKYILAAHKLGKKHEIKRYLVDYRKARNTDTIINNYQFANEDMKQTPGIDLTAVVALLISPEDHSHDFIETVAKNSGLNVKLFRDKKKAIKYLKNE